MTRTAVGAQTDPIPKRLCKEEEEHCYFSDGVGEHQFVYIYIYMCMNIERGEKK